MKAIIEGMMMEKFEDNRGDKKKNKVRLYQEGEKQLVEISVTEKTYVECKKGAMVKIFSSIGFYNMDGNAGMYAVEVF